MAKTRSSYAETAKNNFKYSPGLNLYTNLYHLSAETLLTSWFPQLSKLDLKIDSPEPVLTLGKMGLAMLRQSEQFQKY